MAMTDFKKLLGPSLASRVQWELENPMSSEGPKSVIRELVRIIEAKPSPNLTGGG